MEKYVKSSFPEEEMLTLNPDLTDVTGGLLKSR